MLRRMCKSCVKRDREKYYTCRILTGKVDKVTQKMEDGYKKTIKTFVCTECGHTWQSSRRHL